MSEHPQTSHLYIKTKIFEFNIYYISVDISKSILVVVLVPVVAPLPSGAAVVSQIAQKTESFQRVGHYNPGRGRPVNAIKILFKSGHQNSLRIVHYKPITLDL